MLTVVEKKKKTRPDMSDHLRFWECVCDCGNRSVVFQGNLLTGATRSCGCINTRTWRGKRFGKLTILSAAPIVHNMRYWNVRCDCGRIHTVSRDVLFRAANVYCDCGSDKPKIDLAGQVFGRLTVLMRVRQGSRCIPKASFEQKYQELRMPEAVSESDFRNQADRQS